MSKTTILIIIAAIILGILAVIFLPSILGQSAELEDQKLDAQLMQQFNEGDQQP